MPQYDSKPRRRLWPVLVPFVLVVVLGVGWTGFWYSAASVAETAIAGWRERESRSGRDYSCSRETVGGFPFRIEVRCADPDISLQRTDIRLKAADLIVLAQVYEPTLLIAEVTAPMTVTDAAQVYVANWKTAQTSLRGTPRAPERVSIVLDSPTLDHRIGSSLVTQFKAAHVELHGRIAEGAVTSNPVVDVALLMTAAVAPELHSITASPLDAEITATVRGLADLSPKPWPDRLRDLQARGGKIEITRARLQQGDIIAVSNGTLGLTARGGLDGQLDITVVNLDKAVKALDIERLMADGNIGAKIDSLDRIIPGLSRLARQNAAPGAVAALNAIGKRTTLEGKQATILPLRFSDGQVLLGPIPVGRVPPLF
jgi:hypothetical protein